MKQLTPTAIYAKVLREMKLGVRQNRIYICENNRWKVAMDSEMPIKIRALYDNGQQREISSGAVREVIERILQSPDLQLHFVEEEEESFVNLKNAVFNAETGAIEERGTRNFGYRLNFSYVPSKERKTPAFDEFVKTSFPEYTSEKRKMLLQILGYILSDYIGAKAAFFLVGESNSGKSVILELLQSVVPKDLVTSIPLYRLENRFNLAKLADSRVNVNTELSGKSFAALDIFKMITSNERITAEHKGKKPFEFRVRCKMISAGNVLPDLERLEGMNAVLNRMVILLFPVSIPMARQDEALLRKLQEEADGIFSSALDELAALKKNQFHFTEPEDTKKLKKQMLSRGRAFEDFIMERCIKEKNAKEHIRTLYEEFQNYLEENLLEVDISKTQFSQMLCRMPGVDRRKFRIRGQNPLHGVVGLRLKAYEEYGTQDSEMYSAEDSRSEKRRNTGTLEQEDDYEQ